MEILLSLCRCVRAFTARQVADEFFDGEVRTAIRHLNKSVSQKLLVRTRVPVREIPATDQPLATWRFGEDAPDLDAIVVKIRNRWEFAPTNVTSIYLAGPAAASVLGYRVTGKLKRPLQASHDLGLAGVYLAVRRDRPHLAKFWFGEDAAPKQLGSVPDAIYINGDGKTSIAFEFCGLYSVKRLRAFHQHCAQRRLRYELW